MNTMSCEKHLGMGTVQNCAPCLQVELDDAWLEWEVSALVGDDAALSARSGEDAAMSREGEA